MSAAPTISGVCEQARRTAASSSAPDRLRVAAGFHSACRARRLSRPGQEVATCACPCHHLPEPTPLGEIIEKHRLARLEAAGVDPIPPTRGSDGRCRRGHELTPENTGTRGECLACRRRV